MEDFDRVLDDLLVDLVKQPAAPRIDPCYDAPQPQGEEWQWRPPAQTPPQGRLNLAYVAQSLGGPLSAPQQEALQAQSRALNQQRVVLLQCDTGQLYAYAQALHQLGLLLVCGDGDYGSFFAESRSHSPEFLYEYAQTLLLLGARLNDKAVGLPDGEARVSLYMQLQALFEQLHQCAASVLGERYEAARRARWHYRAPPVTSQLSSNGATRVTQPPGDELRRLRNWIQGDLGGVAQLQAHALLYGAKANEVRARYLLAKLATEADLTRHNEQLYQVVAPLMQCVADDYDAIVRQLAPATQLSQYAARRRLWWDTQQQLQLARSDFARFRAGDSFDAYGKRALRRLEALQDFDAQEHTTIALLYEEVYTALSTGYTSGGTALPMDVPQGQVGRRLDFATECARHWQTYAHAATIEAGLQTLQQLRQCGPAPLAYDAVAKTEAPRLGNEAKQELLLDRQDTLRWLLGHVDAHGQIVLGAADCEALQLKLHDVETQLQANRSLLQKL